MNLQYIVYVTRPLVQPAELMLGVLLTLPHTCWEQKPLPVWFVGRVRLKDCGIVVHKMHKCIFCIFLKHLCLGLFDKFVCVLIMSC